MTLRTLLALSILALAAAATVQARPGAPPCSPLGLKYQPGACEKWKREHPDVNPDGVVQTVTIVNNSSSVLGGYVTFWHANNEHTDVDLPGVKPGETWTANGSWTVGQAPYYLLYSSFQDSYGDPVTFYAVPISKYPALAKKLPPEPDNCQSNHFRMVFGDGPQYVYEQHSGAVVTGGQTDKNTLCQILGCPTGGSTAGGLSTQNRTTSRSAPQPVYFRSCDP